MIHLGDRAICLVKVLLANACASLVNMLPAAMQAKMLRKNRIAGRIESAVPDSTHNALSKSQELAKSKNKCSLNKFTRFLGIVDLVEKIYKKPELQDSM